MANLWMATSQHLNRNLKKIKQLQQKEELVDWIEVSSRQKNKSPLEDLNYLMKSNQVNYQEIFRETVSRKIE